MMRAVARTCTVAVLLIAGLAPGAAQDAPEKKPRPPGKGDAVVVKGCLSRGVLAAHDTRKEDDDAAATTSPIDFRLTGSKRILKPFREEHEGHLEEVTGVLKSHLPDEKSAKGMRIGGTGIFIGGGAPRAGGIQEMTPHLPVLEVKSVRHIGDRCGL